jgi:PAS domain-containing protein
MEPLPTLPRRSWLERASFTLSVIVTLIGAATLLGWWLRVDEVLQPFVAQPAMKPNEALGFLLLGASVLLLALAPRRFPLLALAPALIGAVTLLQRMLGRDLHIDELLARDHIMLLTAYPGRMSELVATGLVLSGLSLAWRATPRWPLARLFAEAVSGSILAAAGLSTLLGYVAHLPAVHNWGSATATPPVAAVCLLLFGSVLIMLAWRESTKIQKGPPAWAPVPAVIGCLTLTVILWVGLSDRENFILRQRTQSSMTQLALQLGSTVDQQATEIERLARRWSENPDLWTPDAAELMAKSGPLGCVRIAFVDIAQRTRWIYPLAGNEAFIGYEHAGVEERREALESARKLDTGAPIISASVPILNPAAAKGMEKGAVVYAPVLRGSRITGYLAAEYVYETMFGRSIAALPANLGSDYHITITIGGQIVFRRGGDAPARTDDLTVNRTVNLANRLVHLSLTPSPRALADDRRLLPELALVAGFGISILLGITFHLARSARAGQRAAETSNKLLFTENEERRRVEARLKVSDERLRLALDSTQIGIFEWNVPTGHVYYSPGLWAMLGYEVSRMPPTAEAWQTLVHADDLPLYRRRTDSQLKGIATFIEPEPTTATGGGSTRVRNPSHSIPTGVPPASLGPSRTSRPAARPKSLSGSPRPKPANCPSSPPRRTTLSSSAPPTDALSGPTKLFAASWNTASKKWSGETPPSSWSGPKRASARWRESVAR